MGLGASTGVEPGNIWGFGFSYVYRKAVWQSRPFEDLNFGEDAAFVTGAGERYRLAHVRDVKGIGLHILHRDNTSRCFPQYLLPDFMVDLIFPAGVRACHSSGVIIGLKNAGGIGRPEA